MDLLTLIVIAIAFYAVYYRFLRKDLKDLLSGTIRTLESSFPRPNVQLPPTFVLDPKVNADLVDEDAEGEEELLVGEDEEIIESARPVVTNGKGDAAERVRKAVDRLPSLVRLDDIVIPAGQPFAVPIGKDHNGRQRFLDFSDDTQNVAVYGTSGSGKDTMMMGWFIALTSRNEPEDVQFVVLDGKGHWITPNLKGLAHMLTDPCGGYGDEGNEIIEEGLTLVDNEAMRRSALIFGNGFRSREQYVTKTGCKLPLIIILITDGMDAIQGLIEHLLISLASKGRALGFKVVVSMSTPTRRDMRWRINLSTVLCGPLIDRSQNPVALGLPADAIVYPPSFLPDPKRRHGTFVARLGSDQAVVQAPFISDEEFDKKVETLPRRDVVTAKIALEEPPVEAPIARAMGVPRRQEGSPEDFAAETIIDAPGSKIPGMALYEAYVEWCGDNGRIPVNNTLFGIGIRKLGFEKSRTGKGSIAYLDIALVNTEEKE